MVAAESEKISFFAYWLALIIGFGVCSNNMAIYDLKIMYYVLSKNHVVIKVEDKVYNPYGPMRAFGKRGLYVGYIVVEKDYGINQFQDYPAVEWTASSLPHDPVMLYRERSVTEIPKQWESEYFWNVS